jgi:hypothetical protein
MNSFVFLDFILKQNEFTIGDWGLKSWAFPNIFDVLESAFSLTMEGNSKYSPIQKFVGLHLVT